MPKQYSRTTKSDASRAKHLLEVAGVMIAAIVMIFTIRSYYLEQAVNTPVVRILESSNLTPSDKKLLSATQETLHRVYCNYYIRLSNQGGVDATVDKVIARITYEGQQLNLDINDLNGMTGSIEDVLFTTYFKDDVPSAPKIISRSVGYLYPVVEVEVYDRLYEMEYITGWSNSIGPEVRPISVSFKVLFIDQESVQTEEFYCSGLIPK